MEKTQYEINQLLLETAETGNLVKAEALLQAGADPLGPIDENGTYGSVLGGLFCSASEGGISAKKLPDLVQLFYNYGMDIEARDSSIKEDGNIHPLWELAFCQSEAGLKTLKVMLDNGLGVRSAETLVDHILADMEMCDGCEIENKRFLTSTICGLKMVMLAASYPHVTEGSEYILSCVEPEKNRLEKLAAFRDWAAFDYKIDISTCDNIPFGLRNATVCIIDRATHEHVWTLMI